jgi:hypothetical protein
MSKSPPDIVKVKVWKMTCPWDDKAEMTDAIVTVKQLLSPVSPMNHADLRAVGLNYKDHAVCPLHTSVLTMIGRDETLSPERSFDLLQIARNGPTPR